MRNLAQHLYNATYNKEERITITERIQLLILKCVDNASMGYTHMVDNVAHAEADAVLKFFKDRGLDVEYYPLTCKMRFGWTHPAAINGD